ncbi:hypothetical protein MHU86_2947 [Fragilaria crotonensis]|nr:hypothetical protein MHU86_2947 [Fragilaria crotonensis]
MHGFRCATEVVTAWKFGQQSDARELAALYIQTGVPIYPLSLGHSYHTLVWKMGVEAREMDQNQPQNEGNVSSQGEQNGQQSQVDQFFMERYANRTQDGDTASDTTYLEEKCLFCYNKAAETDNRLVAARVSMISRSRFAPPAPIFGPGMQGAWDGRTRFPDFRPADTSLEVGPSRQETTPSQSLAFTDASRIPPKVKVKVHRHLVDQYLRERRAVNDDNGAMASSPICLAADYFHPIARAKRGLGGFPIPILWARAFSLRERHNETLLVLVDEVDEVTTFVDSHPGSHNSLPSDYALHSDTFANTPGSSFGTPRHLVSTTIPPSPPPPPPVPTPDDLSSDDASSHNEPAFLSSIDLEVYDSASTNAPTLSDLNDGTAELKSHLKTRFGVYQRRLETLLAQNDSPAFEECLLDFWDEFLPASANIHFYDQNTAVPRTSRLQNFLSKPCPKAFGIVQCEIERIKINSKRKGVNMKGRLFPTYEYRLFIRDRRHDPSTAESSLDHDLNRPPRRDTVLMMAKNRGRKHQESTVVVPAPGSSKKGVNNYYLYMPQQVDVDTHYRAVNRVHYAELMPNGASCEIPTRTGDTNAPVLLGRLQSNFIGTEFQIFTPTLQKLSDSSSKPNTPRSINAFSSDSESDYEVSSDNANLPLLRRNRFQRSRSTVRRLTSREDTNEPNLPEPISEEESVGSPSSPSGRKHKRAYSLPNFSYRMPTRNSRRAVAHSVDSPTDTAVQAQPVLCEEEDGAITYTANLLGNRPRIMDVCVPKVSSDGVAGADWKKHLSSIEASSDSVANSMLSHFKQLQQRLENPDQNNNNNNNNNEDGNLDDNGDFGLLALQNRPPWWNVELGAFVLNFGGRVSVASVKNFQLCDRTDHEHIMLQFGRIQGRHSFTMDFQHPLTAVQAFAIAISSLQSRISFG